MSSTQQTAQNVQPTDAKKETKQGEKKQKNKIQVSSTKQTLSFYVYLAKRLMATENTVELSGLGNGTFFTNKKINFFKPSTRLFLVLKF